MSKERKYGIIVYSRECSNERGFCLTKEGQPFWVVNAEWVEASSEEFRQKDGIPKDLKVFNTREQAEEFIKRWGGHPFWCKPNGAYEIIEVCERYKSIFDGYYARIKPLQKT